MAENQNTIVYAALAVILLVVLVSSFYTYSQLNSLSGRVSELSSQSSGTNTALIASLTARVQALEQKLQELKVTAKLVLFYDSACTFCNNDFMLRNLDQTRQILTQQGIGLSVVDVKDNPRAALAAGVRNVPVFFAGTSDLSANPSLVDFFTTLPQIQFALQESEKGITAFPPTTAKFIQDTNCAETGKAKIEEFYSPTCPFCRPVFYGNGSMYNNASLDPRFSSLSGEAAQAVKQKFGDKLELQQRCIEAHSLNENKQFLNISKSDEAFCIEQVGQAQYDQSQAAAEKYGIPGAPTFVIDCQYITKVREANKLQEAICSLRPELCTGLSTAAPTLPPEILAELNKTTPTATNTSG